MIRTFDHDGVWGPLFDDLAACLPENCVQRLALYMRDPFFSTFEFQTARPAAGACPRESDLVNIAQGLLDRRSERTHAVFSQAVPDLLVGIEPTPTLGFDSTIVLPFRPRGSELIAAMLAVSVADTTQALERAAGTLADHISRFSGVLDVVLALRMADRERRVAVGLGKTTVSASLLSNLVTDAFESKEPILPACVVLEGESRMSNTLVFDQANAAVSSRFLAEVASTQLEHWSLGRPHTLLGLASWNPPSYPLGRVAKYGDFGLFGLKQDLTPADAPIAGELLEALEKATREFGADRIADVPGRIGRTLATRRLAHQLLISTTARMASDRATAVSAISPDPVSLWCVAHETHGASVAQWHDSPGLFGAYSAVLGGSEVPLIQAQSVDRISRVAGELCGRSTGFAWSAVMAAAVEDSAARGHDVHYVMVEGQLREVASPVQAASPAIHSEWLQDGDVLSLRWTQDVCSVDLDVGVGMIRSRWRVDKRYRPLAVCSFPPGTTTHKLENIDFRYLPSRPMLLLRSQGPDSSREWRTDDDVWRQEHIRQVIATLERIGELWLDGIQMLAIVPLAYRGAPARLDFDQWCDGSGRRRLLVAGARTPDGTAVPDAVQEMSSLLHLVQDRLAGEAFTDVWELDHVLVEHIRHDVASLRSGLNMISDAATRQTSLPSSGVDGRALSRVIRDVEGKVAGLEMMCTLYEQLEFQQPLDLDTLEASVVHAVRRGAVRAVQKLDLPSTDEARLLNTVSYDPLPPSRSMVEPNPLALLVLDNVIGNAITAAEIARLDGAKQQGEDETPAAATVHIERTDGAIIVRNDCRPQNWAYAKDQLRAGRPKGRGLSLIVLAARVAGIRLVAGDAGTAAELHLIPRRTTL